ncbi:hypothetical protein CTI12_AA398920 [Artemisia annua]|uniref:Uncharacterized protein n=1 Tax=Artemisia annua TaxID=35608 RepID=A0A2U1M5W3_ARTAN|nr:hypothetical protein CTI12_AA398920 [Artemisia annua]
MDRPWLRLHCFYVGHDSSTSTTTTSRTLHLLSHPPSSPSTTIMLDIPSGSETDSNDDAGAEIEYDRQSNAGILVSLKSFYITNIKSRFARYDPSVHEAMRHLMSDLTRRSNGGQFVVPTSLRRSELQYELYIPKYEILLPSSVSNSMADHLENLWLIGGIVTQMFVRDKEVQPPLKLSNKLGLSLFKKVDIPNVQRAMIEFNTHTNQEPDDQWFQKLVGTLQAFKPSETLLLKAESDKMLFFILQYSLVIPEEASSSLFPLISVGPETLTVEIDKTTESVTDLLDFIFWISPRAEDVTICRERAVISVQMKHGEVSGISQKYSCCASYPAKC